MNRTILPVAMLASVSALAIGCGGAKTDDAMRLPFASSESQISAKSPAEPVYFDVTNHLAVEGDVLAAVDLMAGAKVELEAVTSDGSPIRFELWRAHADGDVELVNAFDVESGFVLTTFDTPSDGRTLLHFPAPSSPRDVVLHLGCMRDGGRCTQTMQPGETCAGGKACDTGLTCIPNDGTCDATWQGGTCTLLKSDAVCDGEPVGDVCGCDGLTYASPCLARQSGGGVRSQGKCEGSAPVK